MKKFLSVLSMLFLLGSQSSIALGQTRIHRSVAGQQTQVEGTQPDASPTLPNPIMMGGEDSGTLRNVAVNPSGQLEVDIVAGVAGLATEATLSSIDTELAAQGVGIGSIDTAVTSIDGKTPALGAAVTASSVPVNIASDQTVPISAVSLPLPTGAATEATLSTIDADTSSLAGTVSGSEQQVDIVAALPTGANTIGSIASITTSIFPGTAAANLGKLEDSIAGDGDTAVATLGVTNPSLLGKVGAVGDYTTPALDVTGANLAVLVRSTNVSSANTPLHREDEASSSLDLGIKSLHIVNANLSGLANAEDDYVDSANTQNGTQLIMPVFDSSVSTALRAIQQEDTIVTSGDPGSPALFQTNESLASLRAVDNDYGLGSIDAEGRQYVRPMDSVLEEALAELVGIDENVGNATYGASVAITLADTHSGEVLKVCLHSTEDGTGSVLTPDGTLLILDAATTNGVGSATIPAAERLAILAQIDVAAVDWQDDANGATRCVVVADGFHAIGTLHAIWFHEDATAYNSAAGDDEQLEVSLWYRRDS